MVSITAAGLMSCGTPRNRPAPPPEHKIQSKRHVLLPPPAKKKRTANLAKRDNIVDTIHGQRVPDPYRWLERAGDARTLGWMSAQDRATRRYLSTLPGRKKLRARFRQLSYQEWMGAPFRRGRRFFFTRRHKDKEKKVWYWRQGLKGKPRVLIDPNLMSKDGSISLKGVSVSWNGKKVAYKLSKNAADHSTLYVMDVGTGKISDVDKIPGARYAHASWTPGADGFFYTRLPTDPSIPQADLPGHAEIYFHRLGTSPDRDTLVRGKTGDSSKFIAPYLSQDGRFLFLYTMHGWARTDIHYIDFRRPRRLRHPLPSGSYSFKPFRVGVKAHFSVFPWKRWIYVRTDDGALRYRLFRVSANRIRPDAWQEIVPERKDAVLASFGLVGGHLSLLYMSRATTRIEVATLKGKVIRTVSFPGLGTTSNLMGRPEDDTAYYSFSSFTSPRTVFSTSVKRGGRKVYFKPALPIDPRPYTTTQVHYPSRDGTRVSMFIIHAKSMPRDGSTPFILYGYGGFNVSRTPRFKVSRFVWLEQGGAVAVPNLRGGGEYGEAWHRAGMLTRKQNTFDDFIAAAEFLVKSGYTRADRLVIRGGSNGGLLVGAAMVQRPELFRIVSCHVPLLDMVRYHLFGAGKTWISEYGSADDPAQFKALQAYSPYHHVKEGTAYPALLMMSADSDDRVDPMHARKFTAAIQHATAGKHPALLRIETKAGHGGGDMVKKAVDMNTDEYSFILHQLKMPVRSSPGR